MYIQKLDFKKPTLVSKCIFSLLHVSFMRFFLRYLLHCYYCSNIYCMTKQERFESQLFAGKFRNDVLYLQFSPFYKDLNIWKSRFLAPLTPLSYIYHCWNDLPGCLIGVYTIKHCLRGQHWMGFSFFLSRFTNAKQIWGLGSNSQHWQWMQSDAITWMSLA